ncbi:MAG: hypothetical protein F4Y90_07910 [Rhodothermaceae bacterium]|nr:hypothetical protein [Rhodothermaceae bacterium]
MESLGCKSSKGGSSVVKVEQDPSSQLDQLLKILGLRYSPDWTRVVEEHVAEAESSPPVKPPCP